MLGILWKAENGIDKGRVNGDVRHHDNDVPWFQRGVFGKEGEQLIVQDLQFSHHAVAGMNLHRLIGRYAPGSLLDPGRHLEKVALDCVQDCVG